LISVPASKKIPPLDDQEIVCTMRFAAARALSEVIYATVIEMSLMSDFFKCPIIYALCISCLNALFLNQCARRFIIRSGMLRSVFVFERMRLHFGSTFRQVAALIIREKKFSPSALDSLSGLLYSNAQNQASSFPEVVQLEKRWHGALLQVVLHLMTCPTQT
jgi:hypothetical protein